MSLVKNLDEKLTSINRELKIARDMLERKNLFQAEASLNTSISLLEEFFFEELQSTVIIDALTEEDKQMLKKENLKHPKLRMTQNFMEKL